MQVIQDQNNDNLKGKKDMLEYINFQIKNICHGLCPNYLKIIELCNLEANIEKQIKYYKKRCDQFEIHGKKHSLNHSIITRNSMKRQTDALCIKCKKQIKQNNNTIEITKQHKKQLIQFSEKLMPKLKLFSQRSKLSNQSDLISPSKQQQNTKQAIKPTKINKFLSDLCVFGLSRKKQQQVINQRLTSSQPQLLYSLQNLFEQQRYNQTAKYLFGSNISIKRIKKQKLIMDINLILFHNHKKQQNYIYAFKSEQLDIKTQITPSEMSFLKYLNPDKKLFCISIKFNDFTIIPSKQIHDLNLSLKQQPTKQGSQNQHFQTQRTVCKITNGQAQAFCSKRILSIFTFYPFFQLFQNLLISLFNNLKLQKLNIYRSQIQKLQQIDSQFLINRINDLYKQSLIQFNNNLFAFNQEYILKLPDAQFKLNTSQVEVDKLWISGWIYTILRIFNKDTFYDTLCSLILEEQLVFVCQNTHILTYAIYLFGDLLLRPFEYPHPCIYIISEEQFLQAPTTIILGVNKKNDWLVQFKILDLYDKTYIQLNENVKIIRRNDQKKVRSKKLKQIVNNYYKNYQKGIQFFKKKKEDDEYQFNSTAKEKYDSIEFIKHIQQYFKQIADQIPKYQILSSIKQKVLTHQKQKYTDLATMMSEEVCRDILRKKKDDPLIQKFLKSQIFLTYLFERLKLE